MGLYDNIMLVKIPSIKENIAVVESFIENVFSVNKALSFEVIFINDGSEDN